MLTTVLVALPLGAVGGLMVYYELVRRRDIAVPIGTCLLQAAVCGLVAGLPAWIMLVVSLSMPTGGPR